MQYIYVYERYIMHNKTMLLVMDLKSFLTYSITHILTYYSYPVFFSFVPFGSEEKKENEREK